VQTIENAKTAPKKTKILMKIELSIKSPCLLHLVFGPAFISLSPLSVVSAK
jgi:hypothetical protein